MSGAVGVLCERVQTRVDLQEVILHDDAEGVVGTDLLVQDKQGLWEELSRPGDDVIGPATSTSRCEAGVSWW